MPKKTSKKRRSSTNATVRTSLSKDLEERLRSVWRRIGHLVDWCDDAQAWTKIFCSEVRLYRATFYWEAVADMVSDFLIDHPAASLENILADCLVATQYSASPDDREQLTTFRAMWDKILGSLRKEIEAFIQSDLELAVQEGTYEEVARLYASDYGRWKNDEKSAECSSRDQGIE